MAALATSSKEFSLLGLVELPTVAAAAAAAVEVPFLFSQHGGANQEFR